MTTVMVMSTELRVQLVKRYAVYLKLIQHCRFMTRWVNSALTNPKTILSKSPPVNTRITK